EESEVVPNLMIGFGIDQIQAEYVAEIKLRHFNREYIVKRLADIEQLEADIRDMEDILAHRTRIQRIIIDELTAVAKKFGQPRRTRLLYASEIEAEAQEEAEAIPDYPCTLFFTAGGYFKKIQPNSLRMSSEHKFKEGDFLLRTVEASNNRQLLFFTDKATVYKANAADFADTKASLMGDFVATRLGFDDGESAVYMAVTTDYKGYMVFFFENGKVAKIPLSAYATKTNRKRLVGAYSDKSPLVAMFQIEEDGEFFLTSTSKRRLLMSTGALTPKTTRDTIGVQVMTLRSPHRVQAVVPYREGMSAKPDRYRTRSLPAAGAMPAAEDVGEQLTF
ncbi:MAG: topoisomerase IV, partial [Clostridia bacterium]|nr:topoisomerase IV [Clostridia bacterium]